MWKRQETKAVEYVYALAPGKLARPLRQLLLRIAEHWDERWQVTTMYNNELCEYFSYTPRHLARMLSSLHEQGYLEYKPGRGSGNCSQFRFPAVEKPVELVVENTKKDDTKMTERCHKGDIPAHRNKEENLNLIQNQNLPTLTLPLRGRELDFPEQTVSERSQWPRLTMRRVQALNEQIEYLMRGNEGNSYRAEDGHVVLTLTEAVEQACARLLIPLEQAWQVIGAAGLGEGRKSPQRAGVA